MIKAIHKRGLKRLWEAYGDAVRKASLDFGVPREILLAVAWRESRGNPRAYRAEPKLGDASYGLMQLLCSTARDLGLRGECERLFNPALNLHFGAQYLAWLKGNGAPTWELAVAAYNCGIGRVRRLCRQYGYSARAVYPHLPKITRAYLRELFGRGLKGGGTVDLAREVLLEEV